MSNETRSKMQTRPMPTTSNDPVTLLVFGAHPDDIEFACGAVVAKATRAGQTAHFVVCSRGESGSFGTPDERIKEAKRAAEILRTTVEFIELDGDAHLELRAAHALVLAGIIRRTRPQFVLAPSVVENQHPDHGRLGSLVRDSARLARYGGVSELRDQPPHTTRLLLFYATFSNAEPRDISPFFIDVSEPEVIADWTAAMEAHRTQVSARNYIEMQLTHARSNGLRANVEYAVALFPNDPPLLESLAMLGGGACRF
jgi:N-acetylglucosamine malate deacetylase 1